ncbi:MAG: amylo-alpha-1,6-glucosidase [Pegethrix bostrychoides GSE-TBD4-15B]|jgi:glycogen debranching enzyme|uniref:Amylo-alpha-1,6-glucosidase n=1 Tax=Pegethrix bostrychoides GSE-TBD4-15B TaxID=2839662 RepID=A0A951U6Z0_9CYAN|nr:amylo-alpha-1,6-glucosidase [Pegethrix bostrychoides GSE-TBD4-15B]
MSIGFGREICGEFEIAAAREWLITNGIGGYASGTVAGALTRRYHGLLIAALQPPLGRTLMLTKLEEILHYDQQVYALSSNRWAGGQIEPQGYRQIERFSLEGTVPTWRFACADALLEKRIWMQQGANTTYVQYHLLRASQPVALLLKALVNYRDHHGGIRSWGWQMGVERVASGIKVLATAEATPLYLLSDRAEVLTLHDWYYQFDLATERRRGLPDREDHLHVATFHLTLHPGESLTVVASTEPAPELDGELTLKQRHLYEQKLLNLWRTNQPLGSKEPAPWLNQLVLAADQFIVNRRVNLAKLVAEPELAQPEPESVPDPNAEAEDILVGKTIIAGYPWFSDWGRDTMISLPGLTLSTGRSEIARLILRTFAQYVDQGMLPNRFPDAGEVPEYNTVDATLWYFEAIQHYYKATQDDDLLGELYPILAEIIDWHCRGTRYNIHLDPADGLLYAGEAGLQLTWMDAKVGDWVVTPRTGKAVEINALWYNALRTMARFARMLGKPHQEYEAIADRTLARFVRFWNPDLGYCYDVLDAPTGNDASLRPNQIFAVSLPESPLNPAQQRSVVETCGRALLTSYGLRSLATHDPSYQGHYGGDLRQRDGAYHQGTVWGWLLGPYVLAHLRVYGDLVQARQLLEPMADHLLAHGLGSASEIFDGDAPMMPKGCIAQAWTVAEILRAWMVIER